MFVSVDVVDGVVMNALCQRQAKLNLEQNHQFLAGFHGSLDSR